MPSILYLVAIAWLYVTLLMALAEATAPNGSVLGAIITFALYGLLPLALVLYIVATPARKRARRAQEQEEKQAMASTQPPDSGSHATGRIKTDAITPVRKKP